MSRQLIHISKVMVKARQTEILNVQALDIAAGQFIGITGTNGAGKTTLLKTICGLIKPSSGSVVFGRADLGKLSRWQKANIRKAIGYIPQSTQYNAELPFTVREIVLMGTAAAKGLLRRITPGDRLEADGWIKQLKLEHLADSPFRDLSGGEQQKVLIARAMSQGPSVLVLDEPGSNLDFAWKFKIGQIIEQLHLTTGITVLMVSHDTSLLPECCQRIILMDRGRILADDSPERVFTAENLQRAYEFQLRTVLINGRRYLAAQDHTTESAEL